MENVNLPVKEIDPTTNYYGQLKITNPAIKRAIDKGFANRDGNLLNESDDREITQGETRRNDRLAAMSRRTQKAM